MIDPLKKNRAFIVAEIGNNHEGDFELAKELIKLASKSGCDAVKFQSISPELLVENKNIDRIRQLKRFELSEENYLELKKIADQEKVVFLSTPFNLNAVNFLKDLVPIYKISSGDLNYLQLLEAIALTGKPIFLSTGMAKIDEIKNSIQFIEKVWRKKGNKSEIYILHCVSAYPTPNEQANLNSILSLKKLGYPIGYSDHTIGIEASLLAIALGAKVIEKHFTISKTYSSFRDHQLSSDPEEMSKMVEGIRKTEVLLGIEEKKTMEVESKSINLMRRSIYANKKIAKGELFTTDNLICLRPGDGISANNIFKLIGKKAIRKIEMNEKLTFEDFI